MSTATVQTLVQTPIYIDNDPYDTLLTDIGWSRVGCGVLWIPPKQCGGTSYKRRPEVFDIIIDQYLTSEDASALSVEDALNKIIVIVKQDLNNICTTCGLSKSARNTSNIATSVDNELIQALMKIRTIASTKYSKKLDIIKLIDNVLP